MSETQALLNRIVSLRQKLEQAHGAAREAATAAGVPAGPARVAALERIVAEGTTHDRLLDVTVQRLTDTGQEAGPTLPTRLTARARRALERGRELLQGLRSLADDPAVQEAGTLAFSLYRESTAMTDAALRMLQGLPDSPSLQLHLCEGIEAVLGIIVQRLGLLDQVLHRQREESSRVTLLADFLARLEAGDSVDVAPIVSLAEALLKDAGECAPLRFLDPPAPALPEARWVAWLVACHGLTVAQVMARLVRHEPDLRARANEAVLAALLHDAGMLCVSPALLAHPGRVDHKGRRAIEGHCHAGAELLARVMPDAVWLTEAAAHHHERVDGTGYPDGLRDANMAGLVRLLAVCDVYAAGCCRRPHRPARETRTALTDTLLLAEQGALDRHFAERLLQLSFYPVGSMVEMADGATGVVVAAPSGWRDLTAPARPVVALVTDAHNRYLPAPHHVDLTQSDSHSIVRTVTPGERQRLLGTRYPEWAW